MKEKEELEASLQGMRMNVYVTLHTIFPAFNAHAHTLNFQHTHSLFFCHFFPRFGHVLLLLLICSYVWKDNLILFISLQFYFILLFSVAAFW